MDESNVKIVNLFIVFLQFKIMYRPHSLSTVIGGLVL